MLGDYIVSLELKFLVGFVFAFVAGFLIGFERGLRGIRAGVRTNTMVCLGSMLFALVSSHVDPTSVSRIAAGVVTGIGFLGAGMIIHHKGNVQGLTTAATIWMSSAIGLAIGFGLYLVGVLATLLSFLILRLPHFGERLAKPKARARR